MMPQINFGEIKISSSTFFWCIGIISSLIYYISIRRKFNYSWYNALFLGLTFILFEIFGAKLLFIIENIKHINSIEFSWCGGYSLFGVFLFTPFFLLLMSKILKEDYKKIFGFFSIGVLIELAFYRIGCMCVGCCNGIQIGWGFKGYFPVQIIESIFDFIIAIFLIIFLVKNKFDQEDIFNLTYVLYGFLRFILEFLRERTTIIGPFSISHFFSIIVFIYGICMFCHKHTSLKIYCIKKKKRL